MGKQGQHGKQRAGQTGGKGSKAVTKHRRNKGNDQNGDRKPVGDLGKLLGVRSFFKSHRTLLVGTVGERIRVAGVFSGKMNLHRKPLF